MGGVNVLQLTAKEPSSPFGTFSHLPSGKRAKALNIIAFARFAKRNGRRSRQGDEGSFSLHAMALQVTARRHQPS
jgi:hypothetical protein